MSKHTPGPWNATKFNPVTGEIDACYLYVEPGIAVIERKVKGLDQHDAANAKLLSAAPDLLEALEGMLALRIESIRSEDFGRTDNPDDPDLYPEVAKARAIIARARGE